MDLLKLATEFASALDRDDFTKAELYLSEDCIYLFTDGKQMMGSKKIAEMYQANMVEGRRKLDELVWGKGVVKQASEFIYDILFTDHLKHKGIQHTYKCIQRVLFDSKGKINKVEHVELPGERENLNAFYKKVGLK